MPESTRGRAPPVADPGTATSGAVVGADMGGILSGHRSPAPNRDAAQAGAAACGVDDPTPAGGMFWL